MPFASASGDPAGAANQANACERFATELDELISTLMAIRRGVSDAWTGAAADSLCQALDAHTQTVRGVQSRLRAAAAGLRAAAPSQ